MFLIIHIHEIMTVLSLTDQENLQPPLYLKSWMKTKIALGTCRASTQSFIGRHEIFFINLSYYLELKYKPEKSKQSLNFYNTLGTEFSIILF